MVEKFTTPKTKEEFLDRVRPVTKTGAGAVIEALDLKIKKLAGPLEAEKQFFKEAVEYKRTGKLPERFVNE